MPLRSVRRPRPGLRALEADGAWFRQAARRGADVEAGRDGQRRVPCAAFAIRRSGCLDEALGAGMPSGSARTRTSSTGSSRRTAGSSTSPRAFVWHRHRATWPTCAARSTATQGPRRLPPHHVAPRRRSPGALPPRVVLPRWHVRQLVRWAWAPGARHRAVPAVARAPRDRGHLAGPAALWRSRRRVQREGRSAPHGVAGTTPAPTLAAARGKRDRPVAARLRRRDLPRRGALPRRGPGQRARADVPGLRAAARRRRLDRRQHRHRPRRRRAPRRPRPVPRASGPCEPRHERVAEPRHPARARPLRRAARRGRRVAAAQARAPGRAPRGGARRGHGLRPAGVLVRMDGTPRGPAPERRAGARGTSRSGGGAAAPADAPVSARHAQRALPVRPLLPPRGGGARRGVRGALPRGPLALRGPGVPRQGLPPRARARRARDLAPLSSAPRFVRVDRPAGRTVRRRPPLLPRVARGAPAGIRSGRRDGDPRRRACPGTLPPPAPHADRRRRANGRAARPLVAPAARWQRQAADARRPAAPRADEPRVRLRPRDADRPLLHRGVPGPPRARTSAAACSRWATTATRAASAASASRRATCSTSTPATRRRRSSPTSPTRRRHPVGRLRLRDPDADAAPHLRRPRRPRRRCAASSSRAARCSRRFPGSASCRPTTWRDTWYWGFTTLAARRLFAEAFPRRETRHRGVRQRAGGDRLPVRARRARADGRGARPPRSGVRDADHGSGGEGGEGPRI